MSVWTPRSERETSYVEYVTARHAHLWRIAYALTGSRDRADDLLQVALEKLYVAWPRVSDLEHPDAYVRRILVRANIDESRRPWRRETTTEDPDDRRTVPDATEASVVRDELGEALRGLAPMQRRCVVLRHWLDLSVAEAAAELGVSEGTVKAHTSRALAHLQRILDPARSS